MATATGNRIDNPRRSTLFGALTATLLCAFALSGCAARQQAINSDDYVEIDNPFAGEAPDGNAKIWVPKASLQKGAPRGRELAKRGYEKAAATVLTDAAAAPKKNVRMRLLVAESGRQLLAPALVGFVGKGALARQVSPPSTSEALTEQEALSYLESIGAANASGPVLFLSKPEGTKPGARLKADLYDVRGPLVIRSFWVSVPAPQEGQTEKEALLTAVKGLADTAVSSLAWFPWYGKVVAVNGGRVYLDGGKETGLKVGQQVAVYRGGEAIKGIGFAPGQRIASFKIAELFGVDGALGSPAEAAQIRTGDYVELDSPAGE